MPIRIFFQSNNAIKEKPNFPINRANFFTKGDVWMNFRIGSYLSLAIGCYKQHHIILIQYYDFIALTEKSIRLDFAFHMNNWKTSYIVVLNGGGYMSHYSLISNKFQTKKIMIGFGYFGPFEQLRIQK